MELSVIFVMSEVPDMKDLSFIFFVSDQVTNFQFLVMFCRTMYLVILVVITHNCNPLFLFCCDDRMIPNPPSVHGGIGRNRFRRNVEKLGDGALLQSRRREKNIPSNKEHEGADQEDGADGEDCCFHP
jgi:hypothetical protein